MTLLVDAFRFAPVQIFDTHRGKEMVSIKVLYGMTKIQKVRLAAFKSRRSSRPFTNVRKSSQMFADPHPVYISAYIQTFCHHSAIRNPHLLFYYQPNTGTLSYFPFTQANVQQKQTKLKVYQMSS